MMTSAIPAVMTIVVVVVVVVATLIILHPYATAQRTAAELCMDAETRDKTRALMFEGLNNALTHQAEKLFDNLLKDRGHEPDRITRGLEGSLKLYVRSRENLLKWDPPACEIR